MNGRLRAVDPREVRNPGGMQTGDCRLVSDGELSDAGRVGTGRRLLVSTRRESDGRCHC
jgi:hypothetical protein